MPNVKIKKDGQEYGIGVIPQSLYDDVEDLKDGKVSKSGDTMTGALIVNNSSDMQAVFSKNHTSTTPASSDIFFGNNIAEGMAGSSYGVLLLYGKGNKYTALSAQDSTANRNIALPDKAGTIALTSDLTTTEIGTLTFNTSVVTPQTTDPSYIRKIGNVVNVFINVTTVAEIPSGSSIGVTIPSEWAPKNVIFPFAYVAKNGEILNVRTSGNILNGRYPDTIPQNKSIISLFTYII